jgi:hypothetical protein
MTWYIYMGEDLKRDRTIRFSFFRNLNLHYRKKDLIFKDELFYSEAQPAPVYPGPDVKLICTLTSDLSGVGKARFSKQTGIDGNTYYKVSYELVISTEAANMKFSLEMDGEELGSVSASYE